MPTTSTPPRQATARPDAETTPTAITQLDQLRADGEAILPVKAPRHYQKLVEEEIELLGSREGPLYNVVYPKHDRFETFAPGEAVNFVEDFGHMPPDLQRVIVHRYPGKLLYFPTDVCVGHCQYCFRPDVTGTDQSLKNKQGNLDPHVLERVVNYLTDNPQVREVIFSGGDPLACKVDALEEALRRISAVPSVRWIRFHTKAPIFAPALLNDRMVDMCARYHVRFVIHAVHPYELRGPAGEALAKLRRAGVPAFNQFPQLRGINDHPAVIAELAYQCSEIGIQMLTMFIADPIRYGATYRLRLQRVFDIADEVFRKGEGWISNFRLCLDSPIGKVKREHVIDHDAQQNIYTFERDGKRVKYHDLPAGMDHPTPVDTLLYRGADLLDLDQWR